MRETIDRSIDRTTEPARAIYDIHSNAAARETPRARTRLEELQEVVELPVDVPAHRHRRAHRLHVALLHEDLLDVRAQRLELSLLQRLALLDLNE